MFDAVSYHSYRDKYFTLLYWTAIYDNIKYKQWLNNKANVAISYTVYLRIIENKLNKLSIFQPILL